MREGNYELTSSSIVLRGLRFHACHGVLPQERTVGNDYEVTVALTVDLSRAVETDDVAHTVNYAEVYDVVREQMQQPSRLLEHVAGRIAHSLTGRFPLIAAVEVTVAKLNPPMGTDGGRAEVTLKYAIP